MPFERTKQNQQRGGNGGEGNGSGDNNAPEKKPVGRDNGDAPDGDNNEDDDQDGDDNEDKGGKNGKENEGADPDDDEDGDGSGEKGDTVEALKRENDRLRGKNRKEKTDIDTPRGPGVNPAQRDLYASWQEEAKADFLKEHSEYADKPELWEKFVDEWNDRISVIQLAKKRGVSVTKGLILERFKSVHKSVGGEQEIEQAREQGRAQAVSNGARRSIALTGSGSGTRTGGKAPAERKRVLPKQTAGMKDWFPSKKK